MKNKKIKNKTQSKFAKMLVDKITYIIVQIADMNNITDVHEIADYIWKLTPEEFSNIKTENKGEKNNETEILCNEENEQ